MTRRRDDGDLDLTRGRAAWRARVTPFRPTHHDLWRWKEELGRAPRPPRGIVVLYPQVDASDTSERAFREIADPWGASVKPRVELRPVAL